MSRFLAEILEKQKKTGKLVGFPAPQKAKKLKTASFLKTFLKNKDDEEIWRPLFAPKNGFLKRFLKKAAPLLAAGLGAVALGRRGRNLGVSGANKRAFTTDRAYTGGGYDDPGARVNIIELGKTSKIICITGLL